MSPPLQISQIRIKGLLRAVNGPRDNCRASSCRILGGNTQTAAIALTSKKRKSVLFRAVLNSFCRVPLKGTLPFSTKTNQWNADFQMVEPSKRLGFFLLKQLPKTAISRRAFPFWWDPQHTSGWSLTWPATLRRETPDGLRPRPIGQIPKGPPVKGPKQGPLGTIQCTRVTVRVDGRTPHLPIKGRMVPSAFVQL